MKRLWHRIKLFYLFKTFGLSWKDAWVDAKNFEPLESGEDK